MKKTSGLLISYINIKNLCTKTGLKTFDDVMIKYTWEYGSLIEDIIQYYLYFLLKAYINTSNKLK